MASADVLPLDYEEYGKEIAEYVKAAELKAKTNFGAQAPSFADATKAAARLEKAGADTLKMQTALVGDPGVLNLLLRNTERAFLIDGLPDRPGTSTPSTRPASIPLRCRGYPRVNEASTTKTYANPTAAADFDRGIE